MRVLIIKITGREDALLFSSKFLPEVLDETKARSNLRVHFVVSVAHSDFLAIVVN